jgi:hypothetical protein
MPKAIGIRIGIKYLNRRRKKDNYIQEIIFNSNTVLFEDKKGNMQPALNQVPAFIVDGIANPSDFPLFTDPDNGDFTITNPNVIFNGRGLERPNVEYTPIPANALEELAHVLSGSEYDN